MTTEKYLEKYNTNNFDIIVNDMKMDKETEALLEEIDSRWR